MTTPTTRRTYRLTLAAVALITVVVLVGSAVVQAYLVT